LGGRLAQVGLAVKEGSGLETRPSQSKRVGAPSASSWSGTLESLSGCSDRRSSTSRQLDWRTSVAKPAKIEISVAEMPEVQKVFVALAGLSRAVKTMPLTELEALPTGLLKTLQEVLSVGGDAVNHTNISAQEGALRQQINNLIAQSGAGTVEISDLRRILEEKR
jgi:hypothetical protein